jgi:hypothetical protein
VAASKKSRNSADGIAVILTGMDSEHSFWVLRVLIEAEAENRERRRRKTEKKDGLIRDEIA